MNTRIFVGLIECNTSTIPHGLDITSRLNGFHLKKVLVKKHIADHVAKTHYPHAEIVRDTHSIFDDKTIELVIVSGSENGCLNMVAQALKAGKQVRLM